MAEDFTAAFNVGSIDDETGSIIRTHLAASDVAGVALAGVKILTSENLELKAMIRSLLLRIENLESKN